MTTSKFNTNLCLFVKCLWNVEPCEMYDVYPYTIGSTTSTAMASAWQPVAGGSGKLCVATGLPTPPAGYGSWKSGIEYSTKTTATNCRALCESLSWCRFISVGSASAADRSANTLWCQLYPTCSSSESYPGYTQYERTLGSGSPMPYPFSLLRLTIVPLQPH